MKPGVEVVAASAESGQAPVRRPLVRDHVADIIAGYARQSRGPLV
jgi:hypothetical protein